jgi:ATP-GRASP peptide maturase of grasp-with-spasm system
MILIQSLEYEPSTDLVIAWLQNKRIPYLRINGAVEAETISFINGHVVLKLNNTTIIDFKQLSGYWFRRGKFSIKRPALESGVDNFDTYYNQYLKDEIDSVEDYFHDYLNTLPNAIGSYKTAYKVNKHLNLRIAESCGLPVPDTLITCNKTDLLAFMEKHQKIITKPLNEAFQYQTKEQWFPTFTIEVQQEAIKFLPEQFQPTLFQEKLAKKLDIRVFFIREELYATAIFSQNSSISATDFRAGLKHKCRYVPYTLPEALVNQLLQVMKIMKLNSGSIDMVYTTENKYYFLEVNPVGQFGYISHICNYHLEQKIATQLAHNGQVY